MAASMLRRSAKFKRLQTVLTPEMTRLKVPLSKFCSHSKKVIFSGIQPTGALHLGNYLGAVESWVDLQNDPQSILYFSIVDLHSISLPQDPTYLRSCIRSMTATLLACGLDPDRCVLFQQSSVPQHAEFSWIIGCKTTLARLKHFPQWKSKAGKDQKNASVGLYTYPVLQVADILLYKATHVPVGEDQLPHLELASDIAKIMNSSFGTTFPSPEPITGEFKRIKSLRKPENKMSKSDPDPKGKIDLTDSPEEIQEKLKKALTDFTSQVTFDPVERPGVSNLVMIHAAVTNKSTEEVCESMQGVTTAEYKLIVADAINERIKPIREKYLKYVDDVGFLEDVLWSGRQKAIKVAAENYEEVRRLVGLTL